MISKLEKSKIHISGMTCQGCANSVKKKLESLKPGVSANISLEKNDAIIEFETGKLIPAELVLEFNGSQKKYRASLEDFERFHFWKNTQTWKEAGKNTLNCLIGCSIGDFGMMIYLQTYYPNFPVLFGMILAMLTGLCTSIIFETILLRFKNGFSLWLSFKTAFTMSFLSMLSMELAENSTDYFLTAGLVPVHHQFYWIALSVSMFAGFMVPLPYNYFKLEKYGKACH
jgi:copper chaperone CopZ